MWEYTAELVKVVDGDTVDLKVTKEFVLPVDFGFYVMDEVKSTKTAQLRFRLHGINTPEMKGSTLEAGKKAKEALVEMLSHTPLKAVTYKADKYGRWLVELFATEPDGQIFSVNQRLVEMGHAVVYVP